MKKLLSCVNLLLCLISVCSCIKSRPEDASDFKYNIIMNDTLNITTWYDLIDSVDYITLKTDERTVMGELKQLVVNEDLIYVLSNGVYCFDMDGNCKFKISNRGRARNEFIEATTLSVSDGNLYLYDKIKGKGLIYDAQTGKFLEDIDIPIGGRKVYFINNYFIFDAVNTGGPNINRFITYSQKWPDQKKNSYFSDEEHLRSIGGTCTWTNNGLIYSSYLRNISWKIDSKECIPYIKIVVPERNRLSDKVINAMIEDKTISAKGYNALNSIYGLSSINECETNITGSLFDNQNNSPLFFVYDKITGNSRFFRSLTNVEPWHIIPIGEYSTGDRNYMYSIVSSESIQLAKKIVGSDGNVPEEEKYRQAFNVFQNIKNDDNPIVAKFKFKAI